MIRILYSFILYPILWLGFWLLSFKDGKVRQGFLLRRNKAWLRPFQAPTRWIWFHVASGELEYAKPVIGELKKPGRLPPNFKILVTFFSPSVLGALEKTKDVDLFVPMPWDTSRAWDEFLRHFKPAALAIARTDTWPQMIWQTRKHKIPSILFSATLPRNSGRYASFWGRILYGHIVEDLSLISCVTEEDRDNFSRLSDELNISVDGDTRFDQVIARVNEKRPVKSAVENLTPSCFVAGSTWPEDEAILLPALQKPAQLGLKIILAPHEPTPGHLRDLEEKCARLGLRSRRYGTLGEQAESPILLIDQVGILADLYRLGHVAFVGGSFRKSVHSVMEPAASGCLCLFGPYHFNSREALALKAQGFAREIQTSGDLEDILMREMQKTPQELLGRQRAIINYVEMNRGVSEKVAKWIVDSI